METNWSDAMNIIDELVTTDAIGLAERRSRNVADDLLNP